jgi:hypothetical protein
MESFGKDFLKRWIGSSVISFTAQAMLLPWLTQWMLESTVNDVLFNPSFTFQFTATAILNGLIAAAVWTTYQVTYDAAKKVAK